MLIDIVLVMHLKAIFVYSREGIWSTGLLAGVDIAVAFLGYFVMRFCDEDEIGSINTSVY